MNIVFSMPIRQGERTDRPEWPEGWPVPRVGDGIVNRQDETFKVTAVDWYPEGEYSEEPADQQPFVYVVVR